MRGILHFAGMILLVLSFAVPGVRAEGPIGYKALKIKGTFDDAEFDLKDAIVNRGLKVDRIGHLGEMLSRTSGAVSSGKSPYIHARYYQFCSAKLTHEVVTADPFNISICPYVVFLFELKSAPGVIHVGYRRPFGGTSAIAKSAIDKVEALLSAVITEVAK